MSDFFGEDTNASSVNIFGLSENAFEKGLRSLNSEKNRILIAELSMGLQHITLREDVNSSNIVQIMFGL